MIILQPNNNETHYKLDVYNRSSCQRLQIRRL